MITYTKLILYGINISKKKEKTVFVLNCSDCHFCYAADIPKF